jgi:hypothetical protein
LIAAHFAQCCQENGLPLGNLKVFSKSEAVLLFRGMSVQIRRSGTERKSLSWPTATQNN